MKKGASSVMDPRAQELLVERALGGLDPAELRELDALGTEDDSFDLAAAAVALAALPREAMPAELAAKVLAAAGVAGPAAGVAGPAVASAAPVVAPAPRPAPRRPAWRQPAWQVAAASLVIAVGAAWWASQRAGAGVVTVQVPVPVVAQPVPPPTPSEARRALIAGAADVAQFAWTRTKDAAAAGVSGDVVWSAAAQRGYMRFVGLAPNDPHALQYQLWIFDQARDQAFPVDGGVFDVGPAGEAIVPITAKLAVARPVLFAITIERPGGVVVSKREHIVVTAGPPG